MATNNTIRVYETNLKRIIMLLERTLPIDRFVSIDSILDFFNNNSIFCSKEELEYILSIMMIESGSVIKKNYLQKNAEYCLLDQNTRGTTYSISYHEVIDDRPNDNKSFLLISDTHFGSDEENYVLINNLYSYAKKQNVCACFHLGDIFKMDEGNIDKIRELYGRFEKYYPRGIKTYSICGNHDEYMHTISPIRPIYAGSKSDIPLDIRILNSLNPDFNSFAYDSFKTNINNTRFHFNHKLYISRALRNKKIDKLSDIGDEVKWFSYEERVLISGHLHDGFIYTTSDNIYLGVPSSSNLNKNGIVGYILDTSNNGCVIRVLKSNNDEIHEEEHFLIQYDNIPVIKKEYTSTAKKLKNKM